MATARSKASPKKTAKKKTGTRKGSPNRDYEVIVTVPKRCPRCGGTSFEAVPGAQPVVRHQKGVAPDGEPYNRIVWRKQRCTNPACRQYISRRSFEFHPQDEPAPAESDTPSIKPAD